jgi:hypothetical protein
MDETLSFPAAEVSPDPRILDTPFEIEPGFVINLFALWTGMSWYLGKSYPYWKLRVRVITGALTGLALVVADVGHALAHSISARAAGAPMDRVKLSSGMPRTVYEDQDVPPRAHIQRALGGPLFSALGLVISLGVRTLVPRGSVAHEVASWSSIGHGLIFAGSLAPLPIVDGGSILKWSLVESGKTPSTADDIVEQAGIATGVATCTAGAALAVRRSWLPAAGLFAAGLVAIAAANGKIR